MKHILKKLLVWTLTLALVITSTATGGFTGVSKARAQDRDLTDVQQVEQKLFEGIKEKNESPDKITGNLLAPKGSDGIYYAGKGFLDWNFTYGENSGKVKVEVKSSSHPEIINPNTMKVKLPQEDTQVTLSGRLSPINQGTGDPQDFSLVLTAKARSSVKMPIDYVEEHLFDAIKGENTSPDNITTYLARLKEKNKTKAWVNEYNHEVEFETNKNGIQVEFTGSSNEAILSSQTLKLTFPEETTTVTLTAKLTHKAQGYDEEKTVELPLTIQGTKIHDPGPEKTMTWAVKNQLFDAIKGENTSPDNVTSDLVLPDGKLPIYAKGSIDNINWKGKSYYHNAKVEFTACDHPEIIDISNLAITRPSQDTQVKLSVKVSPRYNTDGDLEILDLVLNIKAKQKPKNYLNDIDETKLFDAIKGENTSKEEIKKDLTFPADATASPFYAKVDEEGNLTWQPAQEGAQLEVKLTNNTDTATISSENLKVTRGDADKSVSLTFQAKDLTREDGGEDPITKDITLALKVLKKPAMLPDNLRTELREQIRLFEAVKANLTDGYLLNGYNLDKDNIVRSMDIQFKDVYFDDNDTLYWERDAKQSKRKGFCLSYRDIEDRSFEFEYPDGGGGLFHPYNLVLQKRPAVDTRVRIGHYIESFKFQQYMDKYPEDEELQKIRKQMVWTEVTVKAINAKADNFVVGDKTIQAQEGQRDYSVLLPDTKDKIKLTVNPQNRGAAIVLDGTALNHEFSKDVTLTNGYKTVGVRITDEDYLEDNTRQIESYKITVASQAYLESEIAKLPEVADASQADKDKAGELLEQYMNLSDTDKSKIEGGDKLLAYKDPNWDGKAKYKAQLDLVAKGLFDAIKADNPSADAVYTNMDGKYYAQVKDGKASYTKEAVDSDVRIEWLGSSHPYNINVFAGKDFESGYRKEFTIIKRPAEGQGNTQVTFRARLYSLVEPTVYKDVELPFTLLAYNADLKEVTLDKENNLKLLAGVYEYDVNYKPGQGDLPKEMGMTFKANTPGVKFNLGDLESQLGPYVDGKKINVPLDAEGKASISLTLTDDFKNSYDNHWAEHTYVFNIKPGPISPAEALAEHKAKRLKDLEEYKAKLDVEAGLFDQEALKPYKEKYQAVRDEIDAAESIEAVEAAYAKRTEMRSLLDQAILAAAKAMANEKIDGVDPAKYQASEGDKLAQIKQEAKAAIEAATNPTEVDTVLQEAMSKIAKLKKASHEKITVYFTLTKHAKDKSDFEKIGDETIVRVPIEVEYFDLADYGLEKYKRCEAADFNAGGAYINDKVVEEPTILHAMIKFTEKYYLDGKKLQLPSDLMTTSGEATHLFFTKLWNEDCNWTYRLNNTYPLMAPNLGASADYTFVNDGDQLDFLHFDKDEEYKQISFLYFDKSEATLKQGQKMTLKLASKYSEYEPGSWDGIPREGAMAGEKLRARKEGSEEWMKLSGKTDANGNLEISFAEPGKYLVTAAAAISDKTKKVAALPSCMVTVEKKPEPKPVRKHWDIGVYDVKQAYVHKLKTPEGEDRAKIQWKSVHPEIASVDKNGLVKALKPGVARIRGTLGHKTFDYFIRVAPARPYGFGGKVYGIKAYLYARVHPGTDGVLIYRGKYNKGGEFVPAEKYAYVRNVKARMSANYYLPKDGTYRYLAQAYKVMLTYQRDDKGYFRISGRAPFYGHFANERVFLYR